MEEIHSFESDSTADCSEEFSSEIEVSVKVLVTQEDLDDIMVSALEGGINYWCSGCRIVGDLLGGCPSEHLSRGGVIGLYDEEDDRWCVLRRGDVLRGISKWMSSPTVTPCFMTVGKHVAIDCGMVDAPAADSIVQYALFGDVIYG